MGITKRFNGTQLEQELTKPCPLMPDGKWVHYHGVITIENSIVTDFTYTASTPIDNVDVYQYNVGTSTSLNCVYRVRRVSGYKIGECRMSMEWLSIELASGTSEYQIALQATSSWYDVVRSSLADSNVRQMYQIIPSSSLTDKIANAELAFDLYAYLIPLEYEVI